MTLPADRGVHAYLFAIREHADEELRDKIEEALQPPMTYKPGGQPVGFSDDEMWAEWEAAARRPLIG